MEEEKPAMDEMGEMDAMMGGDGMEDEKKPLVAMP